MTDEAEEIVLSPQTEAIVARRSKEGCHLCLEILRSHQASGRLVRTESLPVAAQVAHIRFEKGEV